MCVGRCCLLSMPGRSHDRDHQGHHGDPCTDTVALSPEVERSNPSILASILAKPATHLAEHLSEPRVRPGPPRVALATRSPMGRGSVTCTPWLDGHRWPRP